MSLAAQLKKLTAKPQFRGGRERPSLLFDSRQAAEIDLDTIYELAMNGLAELRLHNELFEAYSETIFSQRHKSTERLQLTREENTELDVQLTEYMYQLAPYFLLKAAQKTLEYLVRRFRIEEFNVHGLMEMGFLYHETTAFVRLVKILDLTQPANKEWDWLASVQKSGLPLNRAAVVQRCLGDHWLLDFVGRMASTSSGQPSRHGPAVTFWASIVTGVLEASNGVSEALISRILPYILEGLKSSEQEYNTAAYMVLSTAALRSTFATDLLSNLVELVATQASMDTPTPALMCLAYLAQTQPLLSITKKAFAAIMAMQDLVNHIATISQAYDISRLLQLIVDYLSSNLDQRDCMTLAQSIVSSVPLTDTLFDQFSAGVLDAYVKGGENVEKNEYLTLLSLLATKYPTGTDKVIGKALSGEWHEGKKYNESQRKVIFAMASQCFAGTRHQPVEESNTNLYMSLVHPEPTIRASAVKQLMGLANGDEATVSFATDSLMTSLIDENATVVKAALSVVPAFMVCMDKNALFDALVANLGRKGTSRAVKLLCGEFLTLHADMAEQAAPHLLALLMPTPGASKVVVETVEAISKCSVLTAIPCLTSFNKSFVMDVKTLVREAEGEEDETTDKKKSGKGNKDSEKNKKKKAKDVVAFNGDIKKEDTHVPLLLRLVEAIGQSITATSDIKAAMDVLIGCLDSSCTGNARQGSMGARLVAMVHLVALWVITHTQDINVKASLAECLIITATTELKELVPVATKLTMSEGQAGELGQVATSLLAETSQYLLSAPAKQASALASLLIATVQQTLIVMGGSIGSLTVVPANVASVFVAAITLAMGPLANKASQASIMAVIFEKVPAREQLMLLLLTLMGSTGDIVATASVQLQTLQMCKAYLTALQATLSTVPSAQASVLNGSPALLVPGLLLCLQSSVPAVREQAAMCAQVLAKLGAPVLEYVGVTLPSKGADTLVFVDITTVVSTVKATQLVKLLTALGEREEELKGDANFILTFLEKHMNNSPSPKYADALAVFLSSYALALNNGQRRNELLTMVGVYKDTTSILPLAMPLLKSLLAVSRQPTATAAIRPKQSSVDIHTIDLLLGLYRPIATMAVAQPAILGALLETIRGGRGQLTALKMVTASLFSEVGKKAQKAIVASLLDVLAQPRNNAPSVVNLTKGVLRQLPMTASHIRAEIDRSAFVNCSVEAHGKPAGKKRQRRDSFSSDVEQIDPEVLEIYVTSMRHLTVVLELLQYKKNIVEEQKLVEPLFDSLRACVDLSTTEDQSSLEYVKQLILLAVAEIVGRVPRVPKGGMQGGLESALNIELVVQCMRVTDNSQTHHHALLLLAAVSKYYPERVLHNIMAVFTFMGTNVLRQDDNYTFHVIKQSIETIIPPLVEAAGKPDSVESIRMIIEVLKVFVSAFHHIPQHRRMSLYTHLATTLGAHRHLGSLIMLLLEKSARQEGEDPEANTVQQDDDEEGAAIPVAEFCLALCQSFKGDVQVAALISTATSLSQLPNHKISTKEEKHQNVGLVTREIFDLRTHGDKQLCRFKQRCMDFVATALSARPFVVAVKQFQKDSGEGEQALLDEYRALLEKLLSIVRSVSSHMNKISADPATKSVAGRNQQSVWRGVQDSAYRAIDHLNALLPLPAFVAVIGELIRHNDSAIRRKALVLFNAKLEEQREDLTPNEVALFVAMADRLVDIVAVPDTDEESAVVKQTALLNLEILARNFGTMHPKAFNKAMGVVVGETVLGAKAGPHVKASGLVCLATLVAALGVRVMPHVPKFMPAILKLVQNELTSKNFSGSGVLLLTSALTALGRCTESLSQFMAPYLSTLLHIATHAYFTDPSQLPKEAHAPGRRAHVTQMGFKVDSIRDQLARQVTPRLLVPAVIQAWAAWMALGKGEGKDVSSSLIALLDMLKITLSTADRPTVTTHLKVIFKFMLDVFDYRSFGWAQDVEEVEEHAVSTFMSLVLKLSETSFKSLFLKLVAWHSPANAKPTLARQLVFYHFLDEMAGTLKTIAVPYFRSVLKPLLSALENTNEAKMLSGQLDDERAKAAPALLTYVLGALHKCFLYDTDGTVAKDWFDEIIVPLVDQLENGAGGDDEYTERVQNLVVPCVGQLAVAVANDGLWKKLHNNVLLKTRHDEMRVRAAALSVEKELYERLGEEFLIMLPETIPFLAECMEDDAVEVEQLTQEVIATIEKFLGESLQQYF